MSSCWRILKVPEEFIKTIFLTSSGSRDIQDLYPCIGIRNPHQQRSNMCNRDSCSETPHNLHRTLEQWYWTLYRAPSARRPRDHSNQFGKLLRKQSKDNVWEPYSFVPWVGCLTLHLYYVLSLLKFDRWVGIVPENRLLCIFSIPIEWKMWTMTR